MKLLVVERQMSASPGIAQRLQRRGFIVDAVDNVKQALAMLRLCRYHAMLLEDDLPDMDGVDILAACHDGLNRHLPCIVVTSSAAIDRRIAALDAGADDYLTSPFCLRELEARLRAVLRRTGPRRETLRCLGNLSFSLEQRDVRVDQRPLLLSRRELALLEELLCNAPRVVIKTQLEDRLYALNEAVTPNAIEALVSRLRRKLLAAGADSAIETLRGLGYRLVQEAS